MKKSRENQYLFRYFKEIIKRRKLKILLAFFLMVIVSICNVILPQFVKIIIDQAIPKGKVDLLFFIVFFYLILTIISCIINVILRFLYSTIKRSVSISYKNKLVYHLLRMKGDFWQYTRTGEILKILDDDIYNIENFGIETLFTIFSMTVTAFIALILLYKMQPIALAIVIVLECIDILIQLAFTKKIAKHTSDARNISGVSFAVLEEFISNMMNIVITKTKLTFWKKLIEKEKEFKLKSVALDLKIEFSSNISALLHSIIILSIYLIGGYWAIKRRMTIGTLVIYVEYVNMFIGPIYSIVKLNSGIQQTQISLRKIYQLLDKSPNKSQIDSGKKRNIVATCVKFNDVYFAYNDKENILNGISLGFLKGEVTGVVGDTGSGKTTLIKLLFRLWDINRGQILIDDESINEFNLSYLRKQISIIPQDVFVYNDSIWNNIVNSSNLDTNQILKICKDIGIEEIAQQFESGYDTWIGEKGVKLSGGQRQKIALARVLVDDGQIIVMDEATASVDSISQMDLMDNIKPYIANKIVIIIAHRLSIVENADKIYVMKHGLVVGEGNHKYLLKECQEYKELINAEKNISI